MMWALPQSQRTTGHISHVFLLDWCQHGFLRVKTFFIFMSNCPNNSFSLWCGQIVLIKITNNFSDKQKILLQQTICVDVRSLWTLKNKLCRFYWKELLKAKKNNNNLLMWKTFLSAEETARMSTSSHTWFLLLPTSVFRLSQQPEWLQLLF